MTCKQQPPKSLHMRRSGDLALCKQLASVRGDSYSGHDGPIYLSPKTEAEAQYNKHNVGSLLPLQQGGTKKLVLGRGEQETVWVFGSEPQSVVREDPTFLCRTNLPQQKAG